MKIEIIVVVKWTLFCESLKNAYIFVTRQLACHQNDLNVNLFVKRH